MYPIQTYRLTLWLPVAVTLLFLFILVFYSVNEYRHRLLDIKEVSKIQLQETALQLGHSLEYALANNDSLHARSSVARFSLRADAQLAILIDADNVIESSSYFIWQDQPAEKVLDAELLHYVKLARSQKRYIESSNENEDLLTFFYLYLKRINKRFWCCRTPLRKN